MSAMKRRAVLTAAVLAILGGAIGQSAADTVVYATGSNLTPSAFGTLDLTTGQFTQIATLTQTFASLTSGPGGTLLGGANSGTNSLYTISSTGVQTQFGSVTAPIGFWGLANAGSSGFYAADPSANPAILDTIAPDGNSLSLVGAMTKSAGTGMLALGSDGFLYTNSYNSSGTIQLYSINPVSGAVTAVGTGMTTYQNDALTLLTVGGQLYGIDTDKREGVHPINIYTIDTTTGVATATGVTVSGLPSGYRLDTASAIPEPSTLTLAMMGTVIGSGVIWRRRRKA